MLKIILTHDVDSIERSLSHILKRWKRFTKKDLLKSMLRLSNLYNNIEEIINIEDSLGYRSTFFIPVRLFDASQITDILKKMQREGWEIALHYVYEPIQPLALFKIQKDYLESLINRRVEGVRVHNLYINDYLIDVFVKHGLLYDSSYRAEEVDKYSPFYIKGKFVEFPIGVMDTDLFGRLFMSESKALKYVQSKIKIAEQKNEKAFTILFHQESYKMKGGRIYKILLKYLHDKGYMVYNVRQFLKNLGKEEI